MQLTCMLGYRLILLDCHSARDVRRPIKDRISRIALPTGGDGICFSFIPYHLPLRLQKPPPEVIMRVLCLHGMGTSAEIFQAQMSRITPLLEAMGHEFIFVDGLEACDSTEGKLKDYSCVLSKTIKFEATINSAQISRRFIRHLTWPTIPLRTPTWSRAHKHTFTRSSKMKVHLTESWGSHRAERWQPR